MLDIPVRENGQVIGVLCMEHGDDPRVWNDADLAFAISMADILTLLVEQNKRRKVENELFASQLKLSLITENSEYGFVIFENHKIVFVSPSYANLLGFTEEDCINFSIDDVFARIHNDDIDAVKEKIYGNLKLQTKSFVVTFRFLSKNNIYFWREDTANVLYDKDGNYTQYILISRDISDLKNAEDEINDLLEFSNKLNKKLLSFAHIVSHNIRSNTSNLSMIIDLIANTTDEGDKKDYYSLLKQSNEKLSKTIFYLNETINLKAISDELKIEVNVLKLVTDIVKELKLNNTNFIFTSNLHTEKTLTIQTIFPYFESIVTNLISNSIRYHNVDLPLTINIYAKIIDEKLDFEISDNGVGIDLMMHGDKIFGMYKTFHGNEDATGLGLFMTKNQVEALNGTISVESIIGIGTTFKLQIDA